MTGEGELLAGRYRLEQELGRGGMGVVWLGRDLLLERAVAIKQLRVDPGLSQDEQATRYERMVREARSAAQVSNSHVVAVHDVVTEGEQPWLVMEYVSGQSLDKLIVETGGLTPVQAAEIGLAVLEALTAAHKAGIVHRDVKPANVLLAEDGRVVLTDFGIARLSDAQSLTGTGMVVGSPAYMAPEQVEHAEVGPESDLWALGATMYAAVECRAPYTRDTTMATWAAMMHGVPDPHTKAGPLGPVLDALMRKDPRQRPDAGQVRAMLTGISSPDASNLGTARMHAAPGPTDVYVEEYRRRPAGDWIVAAVIIGLVAVLGSTIAGIYFLAAPDHVAGKDPAAQSSSPSSSTSQLAPPKETGGLPGLPIPGGGFPGFPGQSKGKVKIPDVRHMESPDAAAALWGAGLEERDKWIDSATVKWGGVIGTDPPVGTEVDAGSTVTLLRSCQGVPMQCTD